MYVEFNGDKNANNSLKRHRRELRRKEEELNELLESFDDEDAEEREI